MILDNEKEALVDIRSVSVSKELPQDKRKMDFVRQIKNPYRFRCGNFIINACFSSDGVTIEERLQGVIR